MRYFAIAAGVIAVILIAWVIVAAVSTEALWFTSLGYDQVYWKILLTKTLLWLCGAVAAFVWFWLNFRAAVRGKSFALGENMGDFERLMPRGKSMGWIAALVSVLLATAYGSAASGLWKEVLLFQFAAVRDRGSYLQ